MNKSFHNPEPLNSDNAALVFVDHQVGLMTGIRDYSSAEIKHNIVGLATAARAVKEGFDTYVAADASGTFNTTKRETGIIRLIQSGVVTADASSLIVEVLRDNASPKAEDVYTALGMNWATLVGQVRGSAAAESAAA